VHTPRYICAVNIIGRLYDIDTLWHATSQHTKSEQSRAIVLGYSLAQRLMIIVLEKKPLVCRGSKLDKDDRRQTMDTVSYYRYQVCRKHTCFAVIIYRVI
jgi:hypothetical protein